eukprot:TRINITY_DN7241_c0_g1_i1.p1 TRINITY_DN7241_c0_g1~~TRINITY_DN7241_c0_g1_i1.p1  ORF type:complete len:124 (+),score=13.24 TRINITY_DN7241_c0_g1_i1:291-662(+)
MILSSYLKEGEGFIMVYSITSRKSFESIANHYMTLLSSAKEEDDFNQPMVLCGNKSDLEKQREVSTEEATNYANTIQASFFEASALTGKNVPDVFSQVVRNIRIVREKHPKPARLRRGSCELL